MIGGLMKRGGIVAIAATASIFTAPAFAADLGGDCCADLEERVAELEATTARKGNRKVSLTVSGQVNELVYWWDDGVESNVYVGTSGFSSSRFRFRGDAKINADWSAGYYIEIETVSAQVSGTSASDDDSSVAVQLRHSTWFLKSKQLGTLWVGHTSHATDDIVLFANGGTGAATAANYNVAPGANITFRGSNGLELNDIFDFLDTDRANVIRYDSPTFAGFTISASWGEDDMWDVALKYAGEFNGIKIAGGIGYHVERDVTGDNGSHNLGELYPNVDFEDVRGSISVLHEPTGLFVDFAGVHREFDDPRFDDFNYWMIRGGIYRKWFAIGKTSIFGEYAEAQNSGNLLTTTGSVADDNLRRVTYTSADGTLYGIGINQYIDAAAMELYAGWRHFEADLVELNDGRRGSVPTDDIDTVYAGARIQF